MSLKPYLMKNLKNTLLAGLPVRYKVDPSSFTEHTPLFSSGLIDSLNVMELVTFVEQVSGEQIPPSDILLENFDSIEKIVKYIGPGG